MSGLEGFRHLAGYLSRPSQAALLDGLRDR